MRTMTTLLVLGSLLGLSSPSWADDQVPPVQEEARSHYQTFAYSEAKIRSFVTTEFAASKLKVDTEQVITILVRDLAKDGSGGFRIAPQDFDYTFEYRRIGADVQVDKVDK